MPSKRPFRLLISALLAAFFGASGPVQAGGGIGGFAGATEVTQIANNGELLTQTAQQAKAVAENIKQTITQIQQYATMIQNLKQLPAQLIQEALGPYQSQIADLTSIYNSVRAIQQTGTQLSGMLNGNLQDMAAMNMSPQQYLTWTLTQSKNRQGAYEQKLQQEMQAISDMDQRYKGLQSAFNKIPDIAGQVQGLQQLTQMTGMAVGELMDLRLVVQQQQVAMTQQKAEDEGDNAAAIKRRQDELEARKTMIDWYRKSGQ